MRRRQLLLTASAWLAGCGKRKGAQFAPLPAGSVVLALGDSLTHGTGAAGDASYPAQLAEISGWQVVNAGVPGDTAAQVLARTPALLAEHHPALVVLCAGGNDLLRRLPEAEAETDLRRTAIAARDGGAKVVLVAVPRPTVLAAFGTGLSDHPMYEKLATELGVPLHAGGWARVLGDEKLRSDAIHANAAGYRAFTQGLAATLRSTGLLR